MEAQTCAAEQQAFDELTDTKYAAGRELTESLLEEHHYAALVGLVAYTCRAIAMEHGSTPAQADERGEACAALFTEVLAETSSHAHAIVAAVTRARLT